MSFPIRAGSAPGLTSERPDKLISTSPLLVHWALYQGKPCRDLATVRGARRRFSRSIGPNPDSIERCQRRLRRAAD